VATGRALYQIKTTGAVSIPRRLYYAVDRRSVVDQTELVAADLLEKINSNHRWFSLLSSQTASSQPLVVSVLRGQRVTEQEPIIKDPSAFAMVLCTPDMVLSRLLFSAYGCSPRVASREAGLVGQDAWIVLDEAHISDAGRQTLEYVKQYNTTNMRPWWYTCMTATPRSDSENKLTLSSDDLELMTMSKRLL
jgi:CRISPR-associated endonuclease/helicase Cas3